jgi:hypothetical protein
MEKMITDGHCRGLERSHNRGKKDAKKNGINIMSQEEYDKEMEELKNTLNVI